VNQAFSAASKDEDEMKAFLSTLSYESKYPNLWLSFQEQAFAFSQQVSNRRDSDFYLESTEEIDACVHSGCFVISLVFTSRQNRLAASQAVVRPAVGKHLNSLKPCKLRTSEESVATSDWCNDLNCALFHTVKAWGDFLDISPPLEFSCLVCGEAAAGSAHALFLSSCDEKSEKFKHLGGFLKGCKCKDWCLVCFKCRTRSTCHNTASLTVAAKNHTCPTEVHQFNLKSEQGERYRDFIVKFVAKYLMTVFVRIIFPGITKRDSCLIYL
jgi:hypothetical protein